MDAWLANKQNGRMDSFYGRFSLTRYGWLFIGALLASLSLASAHKSKDKFEPVVPPGNGGLDSATVIIVRHAEKPSEGTGLAPEGKQRAVAYADYFRHFPVNGSAVAISELYAAGDSKESERPRLTLQPLAKTLHLKINMPVKNKDYATLAALLRSGPPGRTILICWHHGTIPDLVRCLGGNSEQLFPTGKWPGEAYDGVVVLQYDAQGLVTRQKFVHEHLMPGDGRE